MSDRQVHARTPLGNEVVRYDRAGKWFVESNSLARERLAVHQAAQMAMAPGTQVYLGLAGGSRFDAAYRAALAGQEQA